MFKRDRWRIFRGDTVRVVLWSHPDYFREGRVLEVVKDRRVPQVIVEGINLVRSGDHACGVMHEVQAHGQRLEGLRSLA
jgi:ribosomal protein L24